MAIVIRKNFTTTLPLLFTALHSPRSILSETSFTAEIFSKKAKKPIDKSELCVIIQKLSGTDASTAK